MSNLLIHNMDTAWTSSDTTVLQVSVDKTFFVEGIGSNQLTASGGALSAFAEFVPVSPLDLSDFEELRFWFLGGTQADGSTRTPFYLEFSYTDAGDTSGEAHSWFIAINQVGVWEQRRIGIKDDRRSAVTRFRVRCLANFVFVCYIDELLAVREEMLLDLEQALVAHIANKLLLPGLTNVALKQQANPGDTHIVLPLNREFNVGNRLLIQGGSSGEEIHSATHVEYDTTAGTTTVSFNANDKIAGVLPASTTTVSVTVPVIVEAPPIPTQAPTPAVVVTYRSVLEDAERSTYIAQRDSFRLRGNLVVCSVRPGVRAYIVDYQLIVLAPTRLQQASIQTLLAQRLSMDMPLRINGVPSPVSLLPPPAPTLDERRLGLLAPIYVRIGTRVEAGPRQEQPLVRQAEIAAGPIDTPADREGIVLEL